MPIFGRARHRREPPSPAGRTPSAEGPPPTMTRKDTALYRYKGRLKGVLLVVGAAIVAATVWYTGYIARQIKEQERRNVELFAQALVAATQGSENQSFDFVFQVIASNQTIPTILVDQMGVILDHNNLHERVAGDPEAMARALRRMEGYADPIVVPLEPGKTQYLYYDHSRLYDQVRWFPVLQLSLIALFAGVAYVVFSTSRRAEQNRVWVGMAKETAHQLGTPISSLVAWVEYLRESGGGEVPASALDEMAKDVSRLETITERFSKVGSAPDLHVLDLRAPLEESIGYIRRRSSAKVQFAFTAPGEPILAPVNEPLLAWVIENLLKNALDAMEGHGNIAIELATQGNLVTLDIRDSGKGIPKNRWKRVFEPGFSTKKRGWGLGLTLVRRIVEEYHRGRIYVKDSQPGRGTTFRIELPGA
jgi:two-component system, sporulation sensor kinase D